MEVVGPSRVGTIAPEGPQSRSTKRVSAWPEKNVLHQFVSETGGLEYYLGWRYSSGISVTLKQKMSTRNDGSCNCNCDDENRKIDPSHPFENQGKECQPSQYFSMAIYPVFLSRRVSPLFIGTVRILL